ncbi:MAG: OmpA family protein [Sorangiineae bacterium]|nr:OmpA family protein [Polyangiaceae bacterium]MEB2321106.1 OmpA family protein [Sorangiineae bacterium]
MSIRRTFISWAAAGAALVSAPLAHAQSGFALDRFEPSDRGSEWFAADSLDLRGHFRPALGVVGDWAYKPLVLYDADGDEIRPLIEHQVFLHLGGSLVMWDRLRLGVNVPLLVYQKSSAATVLGGTLTPTNDTSVGDARVDLDVRLVGRHGGPVTFAGGLRLHLPTGSEDAFAGDGKLRIGPRIMMAGDVSSFTYAGELGFAYRARDEQVDAGRIGSEVSFRAAAGLRTAQGKLVVGPEIFGSTVVSDGDAVFSRRSTPFEVIIGAHYTAGKVRVGAGVGPGLTRGFGSPEVRGLASLEFTPDLVVEAKPAARSDRDGDGIYDDEDACPDQPGIATDDPSTNGCPAPKDSDGDGILDRDDACPTVPGEKTDDPKTNGCPPADRDKDGILDREDACVDEPGVKTDDPKTNGCPPPKDSDGDGILDPEDACPDQPGPASSDPKKNGCPKARIEKGQIRITERVEFQTNSATIRKESDDILNAVLSIMKDHPEITAISVEGHTDNKGAPAYNKGLSQRRAASVVAWLVKRGIDKKRLKSAGFGQERPIDSNDTDEGRQNNRRVEFHIQSMNGKPVDAEGQPLQVEEPAK